MGYPELVDYSAALTPTSTAIYTVATLGNVAQYAAFAVCKPVAVKRILFFVTSACTGGTISVTSAPTYGSTSNGVTLGTMTLPTAAAGKLIYKDIKDATVVSAGYELNLNVLSAATGSGWINIEWEVAADADANQTNMIAGT